MQSQSQHPDSQQPGKTGSIPRHEVERVLRQLREEEETEPKLPLLSEEGDVGTTGMMPAIEDSETPSETGDTDKDVRTSA